MWFYGNVGSTFLICDGMHRSFVVLVWILLCVGDQVRGNGSLLLVQSICCSNVQVLDFLGCRVYV